MKKQLSKTLKSAAILSLVLVVVMSTAWAVQTYYAAATVREGKGASFQPVEDNDNIDIQIHKGALDAYMNEQGIKRVKITVETIDYEDGRLDFVFGPSGAYFEQPLQLTLNGDYAKESMRLYDQDGELLEYKIGEDSEVMTFYIPHFSSYAYDEYDY